MSLFNGQWFFEDIFLQIGMCPISVLSDVLMFLNGKLHIFTSWLVPRDYGQIWHSTWKEWNSSIESVDKYRTIKCYAQKSNASIPNGPIIQSTLIYAFQSPIIPMLETPKNTCTQYCTYPLHVFAHHGNHEIEQSNSLDESESKNGV